MAQAFAIATLHVCRKPAEVKDGKVVTPPQIEVVPAGTIADLSAEDFETFAAAGAVRRPTNVDRAKIDDDVETEQTAAPAARSAGTKPAR